MTTGTHKIGAEAILRRTRDQKVCPPLNLRVLEDSENLTVILALPRAEVDWSRLTVVFTSYSSSLPEGYRFEFRETVVQSQQPALFVFDHSLRWYVEAETYDRMCQILSAQMDALGVAKLVTIGDSMGGYAALAYAQDMPVRYALAITNRASIGPDGVADVRHQPQLYTDGLQLRVPNLRRALRKVHAGAMVHGTRGADRPHLRHLRDRGAADHWIVSGRGHGIAAWMKQNRILFPVAEAALRADAAEVNRLLQSRGALSGDSLSAKVRLASLSLRDSLRGGLTKSRSGSVLSAVPTPTERFQNDNL